MASADGSPVTSPPTRRPWGPWAWVLVVVLVGVVVGVALAASAPQTLPPARPPCQPGAACPAPGPKPVFGYPYVAAILAAVGLAALVALLVVYGRTYRETRTPQILGLTVFLVALLLETALSSPFVLARFGAVATGLQPFLVLGQFFECVALVVFLYLSVQ